MARVDCANHAYLHILFASTGKDKYKFVAIIDLEIHNSITQKDASFACLSSTLVKLNCTRIMLMLRTFALSEECIIGLFKEQILS